MAGNQLDADSAVSEDLLKALARLRSDSTFADFVIVCGSNQYNVHRAVLAMHSSVLATACSKDFKEGNERKIDLSLDDSACVETMISYFYALNYDCRFRKDPCSELEFHVQICLIADKYLIKPLQRLATEKFMYSSRSATVVESDLAAAAMTAYEAPGPTMGICQRITQVAIEKHLFDTAKHDDVASPFEKAMQAYPRLGIATAVALKPSGGCRYCD